MNKKTLYGKDAREAVLSGVKKISAAVKVTLGPMGRNVLVSQSMVIDYGVHNLPIKITKDGYNVTKAFEINDNPFEQAGVLMVKEAAQKTVDQAGDGTTTTVLLLEAIVEKGIELVNNGANPMELKKGIDKAVEYVVAELAKMAIPIKGDLNRIRQIATVSANNDAEIGDWIAKAFEKIGDAGVIDLEASTGVNTEIKIAAGYKWDNGWASPHFITNKEKQITEFIDPYILLYEKKVTHHSQVQKALEICIRDGRAILIICEDVDEEGLAFLAMNTIQKRIQCCVVKAPSFGNNRRLEMEDLAVLTGGTYISDSKGLGIRDIEVANFGMAKKVIISKDETIIINGQSDKAVLEDLLNELKMNLAEAKTEDEKSPIEKRIAKITGCIAVIQVGAATETEMKEKLDRFDDAVRATKAAIAEGFVAGAGTALIRIVPHGIEIDIDAIEKGPPDDILKIFNQTGISVYHSVKPDDNFLTIIFDVLYEPLIQICKNAGVESSDKIKTIMLRGGSIGYNAKTDTIEDLVEAGIIDPVKVLRCALQNAASSAGMILTSEVLICDTL